MTAKSDRAQELMNDPLLQEAFDNVRQYYYSLIETTPLDSAQDGALHDIRKMLQLLRDVENDLHETIQHGHLEDHRAQQKSHGFLEDKYNARPN
jgi:hypothetical protein